VCAVLCCAVLVHVTIDVFEHLYGKCCVSKNKCLFLVNICFHPALLTMYSMQGKAFGASHYCPAACMLQLKTFCDKVLHEFDIHMSVPHNIIPNYSQQDATFL